MKRITTTTALAFALFVGLAGAATSLINGTDLNQAANWTNGLPSAGNDGTISVTTATNSVTTFSWPNSVTTHSAGTITANDGFNFQSGTWNMTGGELITRYFLANAGSTVNLTGGIVTLKNVAQTRLIGSGHGTSILNVGGSAILDGTTANVAINVGGAIDIAAGWTGEWTYGFHTGDAWKNLFIANEITYNGNTLDAAAFDSTFVVTNNGRTLSLAPIPEPSSSALIGLFLAVGLLRRRR